MSTSQRRGSINTDLSLMAAQRRASVPQGDSSVQPTSLRRGSKPSLLGPGRRVSMMVKYKQAFQGRGPPAVPENEAEDNPMASIHELPHSPRFSTFLSAEAQYAMMKGYEDKLYEKIAHTNPEVRSSLQRSKTPSHRKISLMDKEQRVTEEDERSEVKSPTSSTTSSGFGFLPTSTRTLSVSTSSADAIKAMDDRSVSVETPSSTPTPTTTPTTTISVPYIKPLRRQSVAVTSSEVNGNGMMMMASPMEDSLENLRMHRSFSLPTLDPPGGVSLNKRLVLTYRLESAMDLLDNLKEQGMENSLSPRVNRGLNRQVDAVKDFNSWTKVWNKEFKDIQSK